MSWPTMLLWRTSKRVQSLRTSNDARSHASVSTGALVRDGVRAQEPTKTLHQDRQASGQEEQLLVARGDRDPT